MDSRAATVTIGRNTLRSAICRCRWCNTPILDARGYWTFRYEADRDELCTKCKQADDDVKNPPSPEERVRRAKADAEKQAAAYSAAAEAGMRVFRWCHD